MRILHLVNDQRYGSAASVAQLVRALVRQGVEAAVGIFQRVDQDSDSWLMKGLCREGIPVQAISLPSHSPWLRPKLLARMIHIPQVVRQMEAHSFDLVHCHDLFSAFYGWCAARRAGVPLVATHHGEVGSPASIRFYEALYRRWCQRFDGLAVPSQAMTYRLHRAAAQGRLCCIPNGIDIERWRQAVESAQDLRSELNISSEVFVIGLVGRLSPEKGHHLVLQALAEGPGSDLGEIQLLIAGDGPLEADLKAEVQRLGLRAMVRFLGYWQEMPRLYKTLDLLVLPSYRDTAPLVILEAMAAGVPVISTSVGEAAARLQRGAGMIIAPGQPTAIREAILQLREHPEQRTSMIEQGVRRVREHYDSAKIARRYLEELYRPVLRRKRGADG
jgi:glycosyltransferase involved in cell wall biosynthesis